MNRRAEVAYLCGMEGCAYVAKGATAKQAVARMSRHWTAKDHEAFVDAILAKPHPYGLDIREREGHQ